MRITKPQSYFNINRGIICFPLVTTTIKMFICLAIFASAFWFCSSPSYAYGKDVHFNLTYFLCRMAGIQKIDSLWIAAADQSMDENVSTAAWNDDLIGTIAGGSWFRNGRNWHAFADEGSAERSRNSIRERRDQLWTRVTDCTAILNQNSHEQRIKADIVMGQFLHFEQDYYAHRHLGSPTKYLDDNKWIPYGPLRGHVLDGHIPDYVAARPQLAELMIESSYPYICKFAAAMKEQSSSSTMSSSFAVAIVKALSKLYPADLSGYPDQASVNTALEDVVTVNGQRQMEDIPSFSEKYILPYDEDGAKATKLSAVINIIESP